MSAPAAPTRDQADGTVRLAEVVSALSYALDLTEGQAPGHSVRSCVIGMRLAQQVGLDSVSQSALFYALLLKDAGCSSNAAKLCTLFAADDRQLKQAHKLIDWTGRGPSAAYALRHAAPGANLITKVATVVSIARQAEQIGREMIAIRCERGADIARAIGMPAATAEAIHSLDEHWDGSGHPSGLRGQAIPLLSRFLCLAQTVEVFLSADGVEAAYQVAHERKGTWFDPALVDALDAFQHDSAFWRLLSTGDPRAIAGAYEPPNEVVLAQEARLDRVAEAFAQIIDAKSPYTSKHSAGVAAIAVTIGGVLGFPPDVQRDLHRAGLLHDIGKLGVPNTILDKPGKLTEEEWLVMKAHPAHTYEILRRVAPFRDLAEVAASHHERLDGRGYHRGLTGERLPAPARALAVADICEALRADRPYRAGLSWDEVHKIMGGMAGTGICPDCYEALKAAEPELGPDGPTA